MDIPRPSLIEWSIPPASMAEYIGRFKCNSKVTGYGIEGVTMHTPCPFCAARNFSVFRVIDTEEKIQCDRSCIECGRSARCIIETKAGVQTLELVQTGGDDPPVWLEPKPRRLVPGTRDDGGRL